MKQQHFMRQLLVAGVGALSILGGGAAFADDSAPAGRTVAYAFYMHYWALNETKDAKEECPNGLNTMGPREQFKALYQDDGVKRNYTDAQLKRESDIWWPDTSAEPYPLVTAEGKTAPGLNLDGKVGPLDFTSPTGTAGVDNQMFRVLGCIKNYRTGGPLYDYDTEYSKRGVSARLLIELTDVDSLVNDDDVTVTTYRGMDPLVIDATGTAFQPGGTQRPDMRFSKNFIHTTKGKIVNSVLMTEPMDYVWPTNSGLEEWVRGSRFQVKLTPERAEGIIGGYSDVETAYNVRIRNWATHFHAYGAEAQASVYKAMRKFADGYPNAAGENTAISTTFNVKLVQVRILHPEKQISAMPDSVKTQVAEVK